MCLYVCEWFRNKDCSCGRDVCMNFHSFWICFFFPYRWNPLTASSKDLLWPRPVRRPGTFTLTTAIQVHVWFRVCFCCSQRVSWRSQKIKKKTTAVVLCRVSSSGRLDCPLSLRYLQEHPGGPLEPAQLHQDAGGKSAEICGRWVECIWLTWSLTVRRQIRSFWLSFNRWKEPAPSGSAEVHRSVPKERTPQSLL